MGILSQPFLVRREMGRLQSLTGRDAQGFAISCSHSHHEYLTHNDAESSVLVLCDGRGGWSTHWHD